MEKTRSQEKELLDLGSDYYTPTEYEHCMKMLFRINKLLGCYSATVKILNRLPPTTSLLEVGCGGGLFLLHLGKSFPNMTFTGMDISSDAINAANKERQSWQAIHETKHVAFQQQDKSNLDIPADSVDVVLSTFVCHHLGDNELIAFFKNVLNGAKKMVVIHDLHRHFIAEWFFKMFSPILFRNRLISHDGLISIRRGFTRAEWELLLQQANIDNYQLSWCFPFRWKLILFKNN